MINDNLPKLKVNTPQSKSQVPNAFTPRHKLQFSFENILEVTDPLVTPNRSKKDQLSLFDEALDSKEISIRNGDYENTYEEFNVYREHLEILAALIRKNNPKLGFTLSRGITGCCKAVSQLKQAQISKKLEIAEKIQRNFRENTSQTLPAPVEEIDSLEAENTRIFRSLSMKIDNLNLNSITRKLKDLHKSLRKIVADIPELSKIPELAKFDAHEMIMKLEKRVHGIQSEISTELVKRKVQSLPVSKASQTEIKIIEPHKYFALETLLVSKEEEIFHWRKKYDVLVMDYQRMGERFEDAQSYFGQAQANLVKFMEKNAKMEYAEKNLKESFEKITEKFTRKRKKLLEVRKEKEVAVNNINKRRIREKEIVAMLKNSTIQTKILENKLAQIEKSWKDKTGSSFQYTPINVEEIISSLSFLDSHDDAHDINLEIFAKMLPNAEKMIENTKSSYILSENPNSSAPLSQSKLTENSLKLINLPKPSARSFLNNSMRSPSESTNIMRSTLKKNSRNLSENPSADRSIITQDNIAMKNYGKSNDLTAEIRGAVGISELDSKSSRNLMKTHQNLKQIAMEKGGNSVGIVEENAESPGKSGRGPLKKVYMRDLSQRHTPNGSNEARTSQMIMEDMDRSPGNEGENDCVSRDTSKNIENSIACEDAEHNTESNTSIGIPRSTNKSLDENSPYFSKSHTGGRLLPKGRSSRNKSSAITSTTISEGSPYTSFHRKRGQGEDSDEYKEDPDNPEDNYSRINQRLLELQQYSQTDKLIPEDPDEYMRNTYTLFCKDDKVVDKVLQEFPNVHTLPKKYQAEIFKIMMEHEKTKCVGKCKHLARVQTLKYKCRGVPYPIRKMNMELHE